MAMTPGPPTDRRKGLWLVIGSLAALIVVLVAASFTILSRHARPATATPPATSTVTTRSTAPPASKVTTPAAPGAPTIGTATRGTGQATVTWSAPSSNGDATITSYKVTGSPGGSATVSGTDTSATVTGLTDGRPYTFTVAATNSVGNGPLSAGSNPVTPMSPSLKPHVMVINFENESSYGISPAHTPHFYYWAQHSAYFSNYYDVGHVSEDNYIAQIDGNSTDVQNSANDCSPNTKGYNGVPCLYSDSNFPTQLDSASIPWNAFMEGATINGDLGNPDAHSRPAYYAKHDPFVYFSRVAYTHAPDANKVQPSQEIMTTHPETAGYDHMVSVLNASTPPDFVYFSPNICDDGHNCSIGTADTFLGSASSGLIHDIMGTAWYRNGGTIIVTFDEGAGGGVDTICPPTAPDCSGTTAGEGLPGDSNFVRGTQANDSRAPSGDNVYMTVINGNSYNSSSPTGNINDGYFNHYSLLAALDDAYRIAPSGQAVANRATNPNGALPLNLPS